MCNFLTVLHIPEKLSSLDDLKDIPFPIKYYTLSEKDLEDNGYNFSLEGYPFVFLLSRLPFHALSWTHILLPHRFCPYCFSSSRLFAICNSCTWLWDGNVMFCTIWGPLLCFLKIPSTLTFNYYMLPTVLHCDTTCTLFVSEFP